jgi:cytochrome c oxidase cbb3-type subunit III
MSDLDKNLMDSHEYDGIKELDNPLPKWWLFTFYIMVVFSAFYIPYYHFLGGQNPIDEYGSDLAKLEEIRKSEPPLEGDTEKLAMALTDMQVKEKGKAVFVGKCAACHGIEGQGVIGPNLADNYWLHGDGTAKMIAKTVSEGVPAKGMPPWGPVLSPDELTQVTVFVASLKGTNPLNPKAPQGEPQ